VKNGFWNKIKTPLLYTEKTWSIPLVVLLMTLAWTCLMLLLLTSFSLFTVKEIGCRKKSSSF
jgi:hypothetical protein